MYARCQAKYSGAVSPPFALITGKSPSSGRSTSLTEAPASEIILIARSIAVAMGGSSPSSAIGRGMPRRSPLIGRVRIGTTDSPVRTASAIDAHPTLTASGPIESRLGAIELAPSIGILPRVGLYPTMPLIAAGIRHDPPESEPSAIQAMRSLSEIAPPEVEPPGMRRLARSQAAAGVPFRALRPIAP